MAHRARPLETVIAESLAEWAEPFVELAVFGSKEPAVIAGAIERFCAIHLGADPVSGLFWNASVGVAAGLVLDDDRVVVVKAHQPEVDRDHLAAIAEVRESLFRAGYPTPAMLAGPQTLARGAATVEAYADPGPTADGLDKDTRDLLARGLHGLMRMATRAAAGVALGAPKMAAPSDLTRWPTPHSQLFDFEHTAEGAETIDEIADVARDRLQQESIERVVAHLDWRVEHVRIRAGAIRAVFDWDSLHRVSEAHAVGVAAAHFAANWEAGYSGRRYPTPEESDAFVAAYVSARGRPFDDDERRQIGAHRTYGIAYAARCGHDPAAPPIPGAAEEMLLRFGERYLVVRG